MFYVLCSQKYNLDHIMKLEYHINSKLPLDSTCASTSLLAVYNLQFLQNTVLFIPVSFCLLEFCDKVQSVSTCQENMIDDFF